MNDLAEWLTQIRDEDEVVVDRRLVDLHRGNHECPTSEDDPCGWWGPAVSLWCPTLRLLALPHADRPGYREEWRP